ncbi:hypothetical protein Nepgr_005897 [Nepenthes gracilis]|uniref:GTD-binding domain-containing protein n=1 Tax=Nepenthes gracilis TaxID=150966 RepID=A0AAD3S457_NEPGR|nr:hypothetical protein Nepgr_005897 [Nepenthes gracilis]
MPKITCGSLDGENLPSNSVPIFHVNLGTEISNSKFTNQTNVAVENGHHEPTDRRQVEEPPTPHKLEGPSTNGDCETSPSTTDLPAIDAHVCKPIEGETEKCKDISVEICEQDVRNDSLVLSLELNEAEDDRIPDTPTSMDSLNHLHKKLLLMGRRELGTEESVDGSVLSEVEVGDGFVTVERLKSALRAERKALHTLYAELEEERNAAAIAANQTMAMINKLREEKATMQMEALHYQRMMEEQAEYDQETLQLMNVIIVKREAEKQELEKELEIYRKKVTDYEALNHLLNSSPQPVTHRDVNSSNSLLSDELEPHLADCGLASWECPLDLKEAISSVCFASPRCADLPELLQVQMLFAAKYGREFVAAATELMSESGVNRQLIELLSVRAPPAEKKLQLLKEIAEEHGLDWDPAASETELFKPHEDLLNGPVEESDSDVGLDPLEFPEVPKVLLRPSADASAPEIGACFPSAPHPEVVHESITYSGNNENSPCQPSIGPEDMTHEHDGKRESLRTQVSAEENKQFVPFITLPSLASASFSTRDRSPSPSLSKTRSEASVDLQDVLAAVQAAAESAERAAAAARVNLQSQHATPAKAAQKKISTSEALKKCLAKMECILFDKRGKLLTHHVEDPCDPDNDGQVKAYLKETFLNECQMKIMGEPLDRKPDSNGSGKRSPVCSNGQGSANTLPICEATYVAVEDSGDCEVEEFESAKKEKIVASASAFNGGLPTKADWLLVAATFSATSDIWHVMMLS